jgi:hypothetical protein
MATATVVAVAFSLPSYAKPQASTKGHSTTGKSSSPPKPATYGGYPAHGTAAPAGQATAAGHDFSAAYKAYGDRLRAKLYNKWLIPDGKNRVTLSAVLATDGTVSNMSLASSPHDTQAEQAANDAFNQSQPLESLPSGSPAAKLTLTFESTADPHGDTKSNLSMMLEPINQKASEPAVDNSAPPATESSTKDSADKPAEKAGGGK